MGSGTSTCFKHVNTGRLGRYGKIYRLAYSQASSNSRKAVILYLGLTAPSLLGKDAACCVESVASLGDISYRQGVTPRDISGGKGCHASGTGHGGLPLGCTTRHLPGNGTVAPGIASPFASCTATFPVAFTAVPDVLAVTVILVLRKTGAEVVALMSRVWTKDSRVSLLPVAVKVIE